MVLWLCRLGDVSCLADPEDLLAYKDSEVFGVIQNIVMNCTRHRLSLPSHLVENHLSLLIRYLYLLQSCMCGTLPADQSVFLFLSP